MPIKHYDEKDLAFYCRFDDASDTAVDMVQGTSLKKGIYTVSDADIEAEALPAGVYTVRIFAGDAATQADTDELVGIFYYFGWDGELQYDVPATANVEQFAGYAAIDGFNPAQLLAIIAASAAGNISGSDTALPVIRNLANSVNRISASVTAAGNRTVSYSVADLT